MEFRVVVVYAVVFCMYIGLQDSLVNATCKDDGDTCQTKAECCNDVKCKKPPHTCNGICNQNSCSGDGINRPEGAQCNDYTDCDQSGAPAGETIPCERPMDKTCNEICPQCTAPIR